MIFDGIHGIKSTDMEDSGDTTKSVSFIVTVGIQLPRVFKFLAGQVQLKLYIQAQDQQKSHCCNAWTFTKVELTTVDTDSCQ